MSAQIRQMLRNGHRCRDIAVTARDLTEYAPVLEHIFARDGIPVYMSRRSDILQSRRCSWYWERWTPLPAALSMRTCSAI